MQVTCPDPLQFGQTGTASNLSSPRQITHGLHPRPPQLGHESATMIHLLTEIWQSSSTKILASPPHIQTIDMRNIFVQANGELLQNGDFEVQIILTANARG